MVETIPQSRRERRIAARKAQILDAAATVFSKKGYQKATTKEIAELADVSEGTLYNYFANKRELLLGVARVYADEIISNIESVRRGSLEEMLAQQMSNRLRRGRERRLFMLFMHEARLHEDVRKYYEEAMQRIIDVTEQRVRLLVEDGVMRPVDPEIAGRMMSATIMGFAALFELGITINLNSPEQLGEQITDIYLNGLRANPESGG